MKYNVIILLAILLVGLSACEDDYVPKPLGQMRVTFPENSTYNFSDPECPFSFNAPKYAFVVKKDSVTCHKNIHMPYFNATLYCSYVPLESEAHLYENLKVSQDLAYEHRVKASSIDENLIAIDSTKVYGLSYKLNGNVASNYQFYLTDSTNHFFRGALYFNAKPNIDSLKPMLDFVTADFEKMISSFKWHD